MPSSPWEEGEADPADHAPFAGEWSVCGEVRHVFTHFTLRLEVRRASSPAGWTPDAGGFHAVADLDRAGLPSLMRKVVVAGLAATCAEVPPVR